MRHSLTEKPVQVLAGALTVNFFSLCLSATCTYCLLSFSCTSLILSKVQTSKLTKTDELYCKAFRQLTEIISEKTPSTIFRVHGEQMWSKRVQMSKYITSFKK